MKKIVLIFMICSLLAGVVNAADITYPYGDIKLKLPPLEDPFPGLGNYYSTLSKGMKSALWNPASLGKLKLSEASVSIISAQEIHTYQRSTPIGEVSSTMEAGQYAVFFRYPDDIATGISTREIDLLSKASYATVGTGINFTSALKINEWLTVGFASNPSLATDINLAGDFPVTTRLDTNLYGQSIDKMQIAGNGKLTYTYGSGSLITTYESVSPIWSGFLSQEVTVPLTTLSELRNNISLQSPYIGTIASKLGNFYLGLNLIPVSATADIDNDLRAVINSDTEDQFFYVPNFDPDNQSELANWINDPDKYGAADGYKRKQIRLPAGQIIATTKYRGYYSASTARMDIGAQYDVTDWLTIGAAFENYGGSSLNFKGNGIATYLSYRDINTSEAGSLNELLQPGGKTSIDIITDRWVTTYEVEGYKLYLEPEKNYELPKRIRYGVAFKRPFLIALDYEQNQTPIKYMTTENNQPKEIIISNLNLLRIGLDMSLLKIGLTLLAKPTITGADQTTQDQINTYFQYGVFPVKLDLGTELTLWGTMIGNTFGVNALSLINMLQLDSTNLDLTKLTYANLYIGKDAWQINYLLAFDPLSSAYAYSSRTDKSKKLEQPADYLPFIKFIQTIGVTYRF